MSQVAIKSGSAAGSSFTLRAGPIHKYNGDFGFRAADNATLETGLRLAEQLIGKSLADYSVIRSVHSYTGLTAWVHGEPLDGIHFMIPLTVEGEAAVRTGAFDISNPRLAHCARPGEACAGVYVGAYAGANKQARRDIMRGAACIRVVCFGSVPCFARAATADGARSMVSLGFGPVNPDDPDSLWVQEAVSQEADAI